MPVKRIPRVSAKVAVDPAWSRLCVCIHGDAWREVEDAPHHCPACGGLLKVNKIGNV